MGCEGAVRIEYQLTVADWSEALSTSPSSRSPGRRVLATLITLTAIVLLIIGLGFLGVPENRTIPLLVAVPLLTLVILKIARPIWIRRDFRRHPLISRRQVAQIEDWGIRVESDEWNSEMKWAAFMECKETKNLFLLSAGARSALILPKRAFGPSEEAQFRELVLQKLSPTK